MKFRMGPRRPKAMMCQELVEVITDYLEGTLSPADRARFEAHLAVCPHCSRYLEQFRHDHPGVGAACAPTTSPKNWPATCWGPSGAGEARAINSSGRRNAGNPSDTNRR